MPDNIGPSPIEPTESARIQKQEQAEAKRLVWDLEASAISMKEYEDTAAFNPLTMSRRFVPLEEKHRKKGREDKPLEKMEEKVVQIEKIDEVLEEFREKNPELESQNLLKLRSRFKGNERADEILEKVLKAYPDYSLADDALEFLARTTRDELLNEVLKAKQYLNDSYGREVRAGHNIAQQAREFSSKGMGSPTGLRDLYRDITGNPREVTTLFDELNQKFTYNGMNQAIDFLLHSLGADLRAKGPSIDRAELHRLMTEARNLLAILWVYRFFRGRMDLIRNAFERSGMLLPTRITFELLAKLFVAFLRERYPSMEKVFQLAAKLGISEELLAQIIIFTQMRDAVRGVAPKLFRNEQHRHDILMSLLEALEELEEQEEEEEEENKKEKKEDEEE